jgi:hypothetical protein
MVGFLFFGRMKKAADVVRVQMTNAGKNFIQTAIFY